MGVGRLLDRRDAKNTCELADRGVVGLRRGAPPGALRHGANAERAERVEAYSAGTE